jgi:hypothetical protein
MPSESPQLSQDLFRIDETTGVNVVLGRDQSFVKGSFIVRIERREIRIR